MKTPAAQTVPTISKPTLRFFSLVVRRYFRRHFRAVLLQRGELLRGAGGGPLVIYANHSSWWDPMVSVLLAQTLLSGRQHFAPMDATPLKRYPILRKVGIFPVEPATARGAVQFLRTSEAILQSGGVVWVTPQGRFADARETLEFKQGLAALASRVPGARCLPLAIEYTFWNERMPETLLRFGDAVTAREGEDVAAVNARLVEALAAVMSELKDEALLRDPLRFAVVLEGARGTGGFYALGRRMRAWFGGKGFAEDHSQRDAKAVAMSEGERR